jgi:non-heme chloroperoxidase
MGRFAVGAENGLPIELHYTDHGAGQPVVLIHGWALSSGAWEAQVPALVEAGYRVITYDRRGFGQSSQPWHGYEYDTLTADLAALLDHLELTDVVLVGFSMGGGEVVRYLSKYGADRVSKVVLASAVQPYLFKSDDNPEGGIDEAFVTGMIGEVAKDRFAFMDEFMTSYFSAGRKLKISPQHKAYALSMAEDAFPRALTESINAWARTDFRPDLAAVTVPTLVIHGDSDNIVPIQVSGERTAEAIPGAVLVVLQDAPHGVTSSHPEQWNGAVLQFLASDAT